jgi:CubicO group peptidase (beta-lactamase class C family)
MKNRVSLLTIFTILPFLACSFQVSAQDRKLTFNETDEFVNNKMAELEIVGLNYAILINGKVVHKKAMGLANIEHQVPMTQDKLFAVASMSKLFSSIALHKLLLAQNRDVNETVGDFLPNRTDLPETWKKLTLKQLLSHTSGIPDQIDYQVYLAPESAEYVINAIKDKPFTSNPGDESRYNATGYMLIALIIEQLSGQSIEGHMQEHYFNKFGLDKAIYGGFKKIVPNRVKSYQMRGENFEMFPLNYSPPMYAAAGMNINIDGLILWFQAVLNGNILPKEQLNAIWSPVKLNNGETGYFGLGWEVNSYQNGISSAGHGGAGISSFGHYRKQGETDTLTIILLTNGSKSWAESPQSIRNGIANHFMPGIVSSAP